MCVGGEAGAGGFRDLGIQRVRGKGDCDSRGRKAAVVLLLVVIVGVFVAGGWLRGRVGGSTAPVKPPPDCRRVVSLARSVTEILFQLGLGDRVVGVSRYCKYPPEANTRPRVGGLYDPNMEAIVVLRPDLVILPGPDAEAVGGFNRLGLATLVLDHRNPEGIFQSISAIGRSCGVERNADALVAELRQRLQRVTDRTKGLARPRVLLAVDHDCGATGIEDVYVAGGSPYFNPILRWAGGKNVFEGTPEAFPVVSREAILKVDPEVIIDLISADRLPAGGVEACRESWRHLKEVDAVANNRVYIITDDYATVPGPRFICLVEHLAGLLHPTPTREQR